MGGDCLNTGCVPSKTLIKSAKVLSYFKRSKEFGFKRIIADFEFKDLMKKVDDTIKKIAPHDSIERYSSLGVDCLKGNGKIVGKHSVEINGEIKTARSIIIATGASPFLPKIKGLEKIKYYTSENIWTLKKLPKKLLILGGGPIGLEMSQAFSIFGSKVTLIEINDQILANEDKDVANLISEKFKKEGIRVLVNVKAEEFKTKKLICEIKSEKVEIDFDCVLIALGRRGNLKGLGLEAVGLKIIKHENLEVNSFLQTNIPNIFVCGDVIGPYQFTHVAAYQALNATINALFMPFKKSKIDYSVIPRCIFTSPEIARVGLNEKQAKMLNISYEQSTYKLKDLDRAIIESEQAGFVKVLTKPNKEKIIGVTIVSYNASEMIAEFTLAMKNNIGLNKILNTIHVYPTMNEANKYVASVWKNKKLSKLVIKLLEYFNNLLR